MSSGGQAAASAAAESSKPQVVAARYSLLDLWHLLSLDAPSVGALWTVFLAKAFHFRLPWTAPLALALATWMLYAADRLADAAAGEASEERHHFHQRHAVTFAACWMISVPVLLVLVMHLPHALRDGWLLLSIPLAAYIGAVHALRLRVPKEPLIGAFFGMAVAMPATSAGVEPTQLAPAAILFALLCWLNCAAIASWESQDAVFLDPLTQWFGRHIKHSAIALILLCASIVFLRGTEAWVAAGVAVSSLTLLALQQKRASMGRTRLRALADFAMLSPLALLPLLVWLG